MTDQCRKCEFLRRRLAFALEKLQERGYSAKDFNEEYVYEAPVRVPTARVKGETGGGR